MTSPESRFSPLAEQFGHTAESYDPEQNPEHAEQRLVAKNILDCFDWHPEKEDFLVVTDTKVLDENAFLVRALEENLQQRIDAARVENSGVGRYRILVTEASPKSATPFGEEIGDAMMDKPVLILTSMSRSHSAETGRAVRGDVSYKQGSIDQLLQSQKLRERKEQGQSGISEEKLNQGHLVDSEWQTLRDMAKARRSRIISVTKGHNPYDILTKGAALESVAVLRERAEKVAELMRDVRKVHITTPLGTELDLSVRPDLQEIEDGRVDKPGKFINFPIGEWSCSPDWENSSGVLVVDGPCGGNINQNIIDRGAPLRLTIYNGEVVHSDGGEAALKMWRAYLDSGNNKHNDAYRLAEFGIGTNGRALEDKPRENWGSSEGEKKYRTIHIATGSNGSFGRTLNDPNFNAAQVHCDMVLGLNPGGEVSVECEREDGSRFMLIEGGEARGY